MAFPKISRRHLLQGTAASVLAVTVPGRAAVAKDTVVGFIYCRIARRLRLGFFDLTRLSGFMSETN
jgi:hypothetical protein